MIKQDSQPSKMGPSLCPSLADALSLHLDGRAGRHQSGPWALDWDHSGLEAVGRVQAAASQAS